MARRGSTLAAASAIRGYGGTMNRQGAAAPPGSSPSPLLGDLAAGVGVPNRVNQTGGWGDVYGGLGLPRPPQTFTDAAFGPFSPILSVPINEPDQDTGQTPARRVPYRVGWNLPVGEPGTEGLKLADFQTLRTLADLYSVARACIEYLKSEIASLEWDILPTKGAAKAMRNSKSAAIDFGKRQGEALKFLRRPDPNFYTWQSWMTAILEEELVYDALSLVVVPTWGKGRGRGRLGSDLDSIVLVSGPTIRPLYDVQGWSPRPPAVAYQQYLYGVPRSDWLNIITDRDIDEAGLTGEQINAYRGSQMMYLPRSPRTWTPYGQSCIEKALLPIVTGLARQGWQNDFYKEGTVPAVYISPGADMSATQIRELQSALNGIAGDPAYHHKIIVLPSNSKVEPQRNTSLADQFDEIIMLQTCMGFGVGPTQIGIIPQVSTSVSPSAAKQMSQIQGDQQAKATQKPRLLYYMWLMDYILQDICGQQDMRFVFSGMQEEGDEKTETDLVVAQMSHALITIDESREKLGLVPYGTKESTEPGFLTATGWIPLAQAAQQSTALAGMNAVQGGPKQPDTPGAGDGKASAGKPPTGKPAAAKPNPGNTRNAPGTRTSAASNGVKPNNPSTPGHELAVASAKKEAPQDAREPEPEQHRYLDRAALDAAEALVVAALIRLLMRVFDGRVPLIEAVQEGTEILRDGYAGLMRRAAQSAADAFRGVEPMPEQQILALAAARAAAQSPYLMGMMQDALEAGQAGEDPTWMGARARLYAGTMTSAWEQVYSRTVGASDADVEITWHLGQAEHCALCIARDGRTYTPDTLPGFPGDGGFGDLCEGGPNCKCWLSFHEVEGSHDEGHEAGYFPQSAGDAADQGAQAQGAAEDFLSDMPNATGSGDTVGFHGDTPEELRRRLASLADRRVREGSGSTGIVVRPQDIPSSLLNGLLSGTAALSVAAVTEAVDEMYQGKLAAADMTKGAMTAALVAAVADLVHEGAESRDFSEQSSQGAPGAGSSVPDHQVRAELEALTRHALKGRDAATWTPRHVTAEDVARVAEMVKGGRRDRDAMVDDVMLRRRRFVNIDGEVVEPHDAAADKPIPVRMGDISGGGAYQMVPHDTDGIYHDAFDLRLTGKSAAIDAMNQPVAAAGILLRAADTGRVLMLQRRLGDETKDAAGRWELPGGRLEDGETPLQAAEREWQEEAGLHLPPGRYSGSWASANGRYHGYVYTIDHEADLPLEDRGQVDNPDTGDQEPLAWWDLDHVEGNPAVRDEVHGDYGLMRHASRRDGAIDTGDLAAVHAHTQMLVNYPSKSIKWMKDADWTGPVLVPTDRFDTDDEESWAAHHQPGRVDEFAGRLKDGKPVHPIVAVKRPGHARYMIVDGHHRYLAARKAGQPVRAYLGAVGSPTGPWDETHSSQRHSGADPANKSAQTPELSTVHNPLGTHGLWRRRLDQLPAYIQNIAHALIRDGHDESSAISLAVAAVKRWASGGGTVTDEVRSAAGRAVAEWEKLRAEHAH